MSAPTFVQEALGGCSVGTRVGFRFVMLFRRNSNETKPTWQRESHLSLFSPMFNSEFVSVVLRTILENDCAAFTTK